jgi:hypothetical protein
VSESFSGELGNGRFEGNFLRVARASKGRQINPGAQFEGFCGIFHLSGFHKHCFRYPAPAELDRLSSPYRTNIDDRYIGFCLPGV